MKTLLRGALAVVCALSISLTFSPAPLIAADKFQGYSDNVSAPSRSTPAIAPNNVTPLSTVPKALFVGTGGDITLRAVDDSVDVVFKNVPSGSILPVRALYIRATGTTATDIVALN